MATGDLPRCEQLALLVVDDHTLLREALCDMLRLDPTFGTIEQASSGEGAVALADTVRPDLVLLDVEMPGQSAADTVRQLGAAAPQAKVVVLTMHDDQALVHELLTLGARAYLHKSASREMLLSVLKLVAASDQQTVVAVPRRDDNLEPPASSSASSSVLSVRELEVLDLVALAMSNRQVASRLGITEATVKRHLRNIFGKLDAVSRIDAVNKARRVDQNRQAQPLQQRRRHPLRATNRPGTVPAS